MERQEIVKENKRVSQDKQRVLNPKDRHAPMMTGSKKVGMMNELILKKDFEDKDEWEKFYYASGEERLQKIRVFIEQKKLELEKSGSKRGKVPKSWIDKFIQENNLLEGYGRTEKELNELGEFLYESVSTRIIPSYEKCISIAKNMTLKDCQDYVKEVVIDDTWVGELKRGINAIKNLKKEGCDFVKTSGKIDALQSVDYELILPKGKIGLQIKPEGFEPAIMQSNKKAQEKFNGRVFTIKADKEGNIKDDKIIKQIKEEIKRLS